MDSIPMKKYTLRIAQSHFDRLMAHLFPGDGDEHGAVVAAGLVETGDGVRLLAREVFLAREGIDYVPGKTGYRALTTDFIARVSGYCAKANLGYFAVHCHGGSDSVGFSGTDLQSHRRGYPALLDIVNGPPVGALVFANNAVAGQIWTRNGVFELDSLTVIGQNHRRLYPSRRHAPRFVDAVYDRQALVFGPAGQELLAATKVGIIGLGGAGSLISEWLALTGVGQIIAIDPERMEVSNRARVVGATRWDTLEWLARSRWPWLQGIARRFATHKVKVAARVARRAKHDIDYRAVVGDLRVAETALLLKDCDFIFLCADSAQCRLIFNALVHQYLIPGVQVGSKVSVDPKTRAVGDVFVAARPVFPMAGGGCLRCNSLIPAAQLQREALSAEERRRQAYVDDPEVVAPSVITLNAECCSQATNDFLMGYLGLTRDNAREGYLMQFCRERQWVSVDCRAEAGCPQCGGTAASIYARGDGADLPCRG
jgi:molybdopterin/thiamine biosynthesis adenylyltransferase